MAATALQVLFAGNPAIHIALLSDAPDRRKIIELLCKFNCSPDEPEGTAGQTPLHRCVEHDKLDDMRFLVDECKADVSKKNWAGNTALRLAFVTEKREMVDFLLE